MWTAKRRTGAIGDAEGVVELVWLLVTTVLVWVRPHQDLVLENLLLRHQLAVLTRPTRTRPRARLRIWDRLLWVLARRWCVGWREHLAIVTPETVVRWHRQGWRRSVVSGGLGLVSAIAETQWATGQQDSLCFTIA